MPKHDLRIDILGTRMTISAEEDPAYLEELLGYYRKVVEDLRKRTGLTDPLKIAVLAGFGLCDEIKKLTLRQRPSPEEDEAEALVLTLISRIDAVVEGGS
ncbi:MAG: cell division protein ZapA [Treponema sp.]|jgi:cell division protein ZapA (FtsZ GTPase activity inhibitor)|nr:cell division protein ZapA [Treponema sp.]